MKYSYRGNVLEIEDARIIYRNFRGEADKFNREGERNFSLVIPNEEMAEELKNDGWNIKEKTSEDGTVFYRLPVKVKFNARGPAAYVISGSAIKRLNENTIKMLDEIDIRSVNMDIRPFEWDINGKVGRTAYLDAIEVIQNIDRFGAKYEEDGRLPV